MHPLWHDPLAPHLKHYDEMAAGLNKQLKTRHFPQNFRECDATAAAIWAAVHDAGLPLVWSPRPELVDQLLSYSSYEERIRFQVGVTGEVLEDCKSVLQTFTEPDLLSCKEAAQEAIAALRAGHFMSAQALAANILEGNLEELWDPDQKRVLRMKGDMSKGGRFVKIFDI